MGWRLIGQFVILLIFVVIGAIADDLLFEGFPRDLLGEADSILAPIEIAAAFVCSVWLAGRYLDRRRFADFGFHLSLAWFADLGFGLMLGTGLIAAIFFVEAAFGWVSIVGTFQTGRSGLTFSADVLLLLVILVALAFSEEIWNRGYLLKNLAEGLNIRVIGPKTSTVLAALATSILFGIGHVTNPNASLISTLALMLGGLLYVTAYTLTGELAIPIGYHIAWNFVQGCVFGFPVSGTDLGTTFIAIQQGGPELWTGGAFGPEAGLLGMAARVAGILLIIVWVRVSRGKVILRENLVEPDLR
jgi:membrane protease YdiL (CAAX protease family)